MPTTDSEPIVSSGGTKPGKEDASPTCREGGEIMTLVKSPELFASPYIWNDWRTAEYHKATLLKAEVGPAIDIP